MTEWWRDDEHEVADLDVGADVIKLYGREYEPGKWEYAVVRWWYRNPALLLCVRDGKKIDPAGYSK